MLFKLLLVLSLVLSAAALPSFKKQGKLFRAQQNDTPSLDKVMNLRAGASFGPVNPDNLLTLDILSLAIYGLQFYLTPDFVVGRAFPDEKATNGARLVANYFGAIQLSAAVLMHLIRGKVGADFLIKWFAASQLVALGGSLAAKYIHKRPGNYDEPILANTVLAAVNLGVALL